MEGGEYNGAMHAGQDFLKRCLRMARAARNPLNPLKQWELAAIQSSLIGCKCESVLTARGRTDWRTILGMMMGWSRMSGTITLSIILMRNRIHHAL
jgi:hypothetical protein